MTPGIGLLVLDDLARPCGDGLKPALRAAFQRDVAAASASETTARPFAVPRVDARDGVEENPPTIESRVHHAES
ncbi:MAG: hypothetical protein AAFU61_12350 [Pseudomonadota bacterium]